MVDAQTIGVLVTAASVTVAARANFEFLVKRMWEMGKRNGFSSPGFKDGLLFDNLKGFFEVKHDSVKPQ